jgi:hypothetical protein
MSSFRMFTRGSLCELMTLLRLFFNSHRTAVINKKTGTGLKRMNSSEFYSTLVRSVVDILIYDLPPVECKRLREKRRANVEKVPCVELLNMATLLA